MSNSEKFMNAKNLNFPSEMLEKPKGEKEIKCWKQQ